MKPPFPPPWERAIPWLLFLALIAFYTALRQANLTVDGAAFLTYYTASARPIHPHHPLFGFVLHGFIAAGRAVGASPWAAGAFQSAFFTAAGCALYFAALRRVASPSVSLIYALLLGWTATALENGASVELYGAAIFASAFLLLAYLRAARDPSVPACALLVAASGLVVSLHLGYALFPLACYLALAWRDRRSAGRALAWLAQGAAAAAAVAGWMWAEGIFHHAEAEKSRAFFDSFWMADGLLSALRLILCEPLSDFAAWAGPLLFPALFGVGLLARERPDEARLFFIASPLFLLTYAFWPGDYGAFHLPLQLVWGIFSALAIDRIAATIPRESLPRLAAGIVIYAWLFMFLSRGLYSPGQAPDPALFAIAFWALAGLQFGIGLRIRRAAPSRESSSAVPSRRLFLGLFAAIAFALDLGAYSARPLDQLIPDEQTLYCRAFASITPPGARLLTSFLPFRPSAQAEREALSPLERWNDPESMKQARAAISAWLGDSADSEARPIYIDQACREKREFIWGGGDESGVEPPLSQLRFRPRRAGREIFYRIVPAPKAGFGAPAFGLYEPEEWSGAPVRWTRRSAELEFESAGEVMVVKYWVGHDAISEERPVAVALLIDGVKSDVAAFTAPGAAERRVKIGGLPRGPHRLRIEIDPPWTSPDGRELGVALYPLEFLPAESPSR